MVTVNLATYPARKDSLIKVLNNLVDMPLDIIRVYLNQYTNLIGLPEHVKIHYRMGPDIKDSGKFFWAESSNEIYFTLDDDLIYSKEFFINHLTLLKQNPNYFISSHGKVFLPRSVNIYNTVRPICHCLKNNPSHRKVNCLGTGAMVFNSSIHKIPMSLFKYHGMADMWIAKYCQQRNITMICRKHSERELRLTEPDNQDTLWNKKDLLADQHKEILSSIIWKV